jgi:hypothetical protein
MSVLNRYIPNPTQLVGLLSFFAATIACLIAMWRSEERDARTWKVLALINCLFFVEVYFGLRYRITGLAISHLKATGFYTQWHGSTQELIIISIALLGLLAVLLLLLWRQVAGGAARLAASITSLVVALFAIETISLHPLDAIFYRPIGSVATLGWAWALAAAAICLAAIPRSRA